MRSFIKSLIPTPALKRIRATLSARNHSKIIQACERSDQIFLKPVNRVEHYFHFLFDFCLPVWQVIRNSRKETSFVVRDFGIFTQRVQLLFPNRIEIIPRDSEPMGLVFSLEGLNPQFVHMSYSDLASFKSHVCETLGIDRSAKKNKVLLIERMPPNSYFTSEAVKKGAGASRRSIPNHQQLANALQAIVKSPFEFQNIQLENLSFEDQIRLFDQAALVIGQHGAGLANCVWMRPQSSVFELSHKLSLKHFQNISQVLEHEHHLHRTEGSARGS